MESKHIISIDHKWNQDDSNFVRSKLMEYNSKHISEDIRLIYENFSLILKDEEGCIFGGVTGALKWNFLKVDILWVDEKLRGQGYGSKLLSEIEKIAKENKCDFIELDTFSFQAPDFYKKNGYEVVGMIENAPRGHKHYYLIKYVAI